MSQTVEISTPSFFTQLSESEILTVLADCDRARHDLDRAQRFAVARARKLGLTWNVIAAELNMSRQAAWERYRFVDVDPYEQGE
jgi:hypothetical protein